MKRYKNIKNINFTNILKLVFCKKKYIDELCDYYVNPQEVRDHLQLIANRFKFFSFLIMEDIEELDKVVEEDYQNYLISQEYAQERSGGCYDCPWGNGEGGCTIPGYCNAL